MNKRQHLLYILFMPLLLCLCITAVACHPYTQYDEYRHTDASGWDRDSILTFDVPAIEQDGTYIEELNIRTDNNYPFRQLSLTVDQQILPSGKHLIDTLQIDVYDDEGDASGKGFSIFQNQLVFKFISLHKGDSLHINVSHNMRRHSISGINDVGIRLEQR
ncbi:MAG: gliding motility lipoprotein GldH [Prevotella sp.]|nr:gliding motility lipoprotein GldH [Prevotella sp.]